MSNYAVIGVDLGGTNVRAGKINHLSLEKHTSAPISAQADEDTVIAQITAQIDNVMDNDVHAIGVGVPSLVDVEKGIVYTVENIPSWREVHLKDKLEKKYRMPVHVNNDANCFALGEAYYGKGKNYANLVGLTVGTGMGAGIVINNRLYNGANCGAGEFGNIVYKDHNLEYYCSGSRFMRQYGLSGQELCDRAAQGDTEALRIFDEFGNDMGIALQTVLYALDPEIVIFGGSVSKAFSYFAAAMRRNLTTFDYQHALKNLVIERTSDTNIPLLGAASLCLQSTWGNR